MTRKWKGNSSSPPPVNKKKGAPAPALPLSRVGSQRSTPKSPSSPPEYDSDSDPDNWSENEAFSSTILRIALLSSVNAFNVVNIQNYIFDVLKIPRLSITAKCIDWHKAIPKILSNLNDHDKITTMASTNGEVLIKTKTPDTYHLVQNIMHELNIWFHTLSFPEVRMLKVVAGGILVDITGDEVKENLIPRGFVVKMVKIFGTSIRPMPL